MQATIAELFPRVRKLQYDLQTTVQFVETGRSNPDDAYVSLGEFLRQIDMLDKVVVQERPAQRDTWRKKIVELRKEADFLKLSLDKYTNSQKKTIQEKLERDELFKRRSQAMPSGVIDNYMEEGNSLARSTTMVNDLVNTSRNVLSDLVDQRDMLKSAHRKVLDIANLLGLSNSIMRIANRRDKVDRWIVIGGMIFTTVFLYICYAYTAGYFTASPPIDNPSSTLQENSIEENLNVI
mmetsp:Transcript_10183/g.13356  ORF Transcript_10183/g.13356 Transcript_10183/m.13356 type:complete len:237 (-) Transcript_10183:142-852(-)